MIHLSPDDIAHLTQNQTVQSKETCPHERVVDQQGIFICLDCGMESKSLKDFK